MLENSSQTALVDDMSCMTVYYNTVHAQQRTDIWMLDLQPGRQRSLPPAKVASTVQARAAPGRSGTSVMQ